MAIAAIMTIGSVTLVSCDKDEGRNSLDNPTPKSITNPYSYIGEWHNTAMYDIGLAIQDSLDFYANLGTLSNSQREGLASLIFKAITEVTQDYSIMQIPDSTLGMAMDFAFNSLNAEYVDTFFLKHPVSSVIASSLADIDFNESIDDIQAELQNEIGNMLLASNDKAAIFLTVMSYSISFWYEAQTDQSNPWFNFINTFTFDNDSKTISKGFIRDAFNAVKDWWNENVKQEQAPELPRVVEVALYDAAGAVTGAPLASATGFTSVIIGAVVYSGLAVIFT